MSSSHTTSESPSSKTCKHRTENPASGINRKYIEIPWLTPTTVVYSTIVTLSRAKHQLCAPCGVLCSAVHLVLPGDPYRVSDKCTNDLQPRALLARASSSASLARVMPSFMKLGMTARFLARAIWPRALLRHVLFFPCYCIPSHMLYQARMHRGGWDGDRLRWWRRLRRDEARRRHTVQFSSTLVR